MSKGPWVDDKIKEALFRVALIKPPFSAEAIRERASIILEREDVLDLNLRTIRYYVKLYRDLEKTRIQEQPWSLATMDEAGIPWEAAGFLLEAFDELWKRQKRGEEESWPGSAHPFDGFYKGSAEEILEALSSGREPERISVKPLAKMAPPGTILTNRQAKWLWRIHLIVPTWPLLMEKPRWIYNLCLVADRFAQAEMLSDYLGEPFDTSSSGFDGSLICLLRDIKDQEASAKKEVVHKERRQRRKKT